MATSLFSWIGKYMHYKMCNQITYPFPNLNGTTVEGWEWISNFIPHFTGHVITYHVKMAPANRSNTNPV